jgi:hypothetical protein
MAGLPYYHANSELGSQKPSAAAALDADDPMLAGCKCFVPFTETAGLYAREGLGGQLGTIATSGVWGSRPGWVTFAGNNYVQFPSLANLTGRPQTWLFKVNLTSSNNSGYLLVIWNSVFGNALLIGYQVSSGTLSVAITWYQNTNNTNGALMTTAVWSPAGNPPLGRDSLIAVTLDGSLNYAGVHVYADGIEAPAYQGQQNATGLLAADGNWFFGYLLSAALLCAAAFNRLLTTQELGEFSREPFRAYYTASLPCADGDAATVAVLYHLAQLCA